MLHAATPTNKNALPFHVETTRLDLDMETKITAAVRFKWGHVISMHLSRKMCAITMFKKVHVKILL